VAWDVVMFGSLSVPERQVEEWLTTPIDRDTLAWLDELGGEEPRADTPEALLAMLEEVVVAPHELFDVAREGTRVALQCFVSEDAYRATCQALALLVASVEAFGGSGELTVYGYQGIRFGERVRVRGGDTLYEALGREGQERVERSKAFRSLDARIHQRFDELVGRPAPDGGRTRWMVHPFTGRRVRVADAP